LIENYFGSTAFERDKALWEAHGRLREAHGRLWGANYFGGHACPRTTKLLPAGHARARRSAGHARARRSHMTTKHGRPTAPVFERFESFDMRFRRGFDTSGFRSAIRTVCGHW
jgi:hypothetical protein